MKRLLTLVAFFATVQATAQQVNPVPDYVFRNQMSVGRGTVTDTAAYFSIGPRYGAVKGFMPPIVGDTATFSSGKRNGLLIFSVQKNKFLYWDSVRVQWSDMAGSSGSYITGTGITGYLPQFNGTTTLDTSALFTLGNRLGIGTSTFAYNSTNTANMELNGTAGGILGFKRNDSARGYLWHTGDNMELANTAAGSISFNTNSATRGSISSAGVWRLHNLAGTGDRVVIASSNGTLSASTSVTGLVDTTTISTRAWRQKGDDSLGAIIATKGSGTVTSVATGYGLSGGTITTTGTLLVDTLNIATRAWRQKGLDSLAALEVSGSGTTNYVPKFTASSTIGNSQIFDNGTNVGVGTASPAEKFSVNGIGAFNTRLKFNGFNQLVGDGNQFQNGDGIAGFGIRNDSGQVMLAAGSSTPQFRLLKNGRILINTTTDAGYQLDINGTLRSVNGANFATTSGNVGIGLTSPAIRLQVVDPSNTYTGHFSGNNQTNGIALGTQSNNAASIQGYTTNFSGANDIYLQPFSGNVKIGNNANAPAYKLDVEGTLRSVNGANFATTSGNVGIGTASPAAKLDIAYSTNPTTATPHILLTTGGTSKQAAITAEAFSVGGLVFSTGDGTLVDRMTILRSNGNVGIGTASPSYKLDVTGDVRSTANIRSNNGTVDNVVSFTSEPAGVIGTISNHPETFWTNGSEKMRLSTSGELLINTTTDAGDYKLQVSGNALVTAGKLDITTNTGFGLSVSRSGTSVVAGQINNSNGILYYGAESSTGGGLFTGSSAYAAVIGSGAAYPLQFATDNVTRATINTNGELLIATTTDNGDFKLQVNGSALISGSIQTANPVSGTAVPWRLGSVVATNVQLDTANYVEVEINGTFYRLAIVTPL